MKDTRGSKQARAGSRQKKLKSSTLHLEGYKLMDMTSEDDHFKATDRDA